MLRKIALWIDDRLHVSKLFESTAGHTVPASAGSWFYVFGSGTLLCFVIQIVTGICLAFVYVPSANEAYITLEYLNFYQPLGWYLRALHFWGSNFMVSIMAIHMAQVFLFGAFKYPRELTWISGCVLLLLTLGMAFTGQIMRFDQDAYWGLGIGAAIMGRVPVIGPNLVHLLLGGPIIAGETLSRFFTLHVFVIPGLLIALISLHLRLVLAKGINEYPVPGQEVKKETYAEEYEALLKKEGVPFYPKAIDKDLIFSGLVILGILACAAYFGPEGTERNTQPDLHRHRAVPGFLFPVDLCRSGIAAALHGDISSTHRAGGRHWASLCAAFYFQHRGEECPPPAHGRVGGDSRVPDNRHLDSPGDIRSMVAAYGSLEQRSHTGAVCARTFAVGVAGRAGAAEQTMPELSQLGRRRRLARPSPGWCSHAPDRRPVDPPSDSGRRQHAGVWQESGAAGSHRPRRFHADVAPCECSRGPRFGCSCHAWRLSDS